MLKTLEFLSFTDPNVRFVVFGCMLLAAGAAIVGCFTFLRKRALVGDAVAHSILPGVALAFIFFQTKSPLVLLSGAFISGWLSILSIDFITRRSRIKSDTAIGLVLTVFFGIGILLMTTIQHSGNAAQSGLDKFIFGSASSLMRADVWTFGAVSIVLILVVAGLFKEFTLISFDINFAVTAGLPVKMLEFILATLTVLAIAVGIQAVGVVLMAALLITPAAAARFWTDNLRVMVILAALFGAFSGIAGAYVSFVAPNMPTGPWIVVVLSAIAFFSIFFAPKKGLYLRLVSKRRTRQRMLGENILKEFYHLGEIDGKFLHKRSLAELLDHRDLPKNKLMAGMKKLDRNGFMESEGKGWKLTDEGLAEGQRITRLHRLWELYLTRYLNIAPDHVHDDAEAIEHVITPEIEARLEALLEYPEMDPHNTQIPGRKV
ncbi:MAG: metal ABC transporter permease [Bacteroidota bacterium]|nr:metal ABC transporter permease [Bacteroidota bacterium]